MTDAKKSQPSLLLRARPRQLRHGRMSRPQRAAQFAAFAALAGYDAMVRQATEESKTEYTRPTPPEFWGC